MTPLERKLHALIETEGPIPVSRYMALCLGDPRDGYYATRDPLGADFITAPEVSQMFGELLGLWCIEVRRTMDKPRPFALVELGPGRGTLMADLLRAAAIDPDFRGAIELHLVETSPVLTERQRQALAPAGIAPRWHRSTDSLPDLPILAIANEFVDALPVDQLVKADDGWHERRVGIEGGRLAFGLDPTPVPGVEDALPARLRPAPAGAVLERRSLFPLADVSRRIAANGGAALIIDYGHAQTAFGDTLQAVRGHAYADPLARPGEADLTAHVDFGSLAAVFAENRVHGPVRQGEFLRRLGIEERAARLKAGRSRELAAAIDADLVRLVGPAPGMGELFKVLAATHPALPAPPGFDS